MTQLEHPNITDGTFEIFPEEIALYLERARGDLRELREQIGISYFRDIVKGVAFLHENGFIHGDVKSSNVLLYGDVPKLNDFGHSLKMEWGRPSYMGTPSYRAPEMDQKEWDVQIDMWGLGLILYEITVKKIPFTSIEEKKIFCNTYPAQLEDAHHWCKELLHPNPRKRMTMKTLCEKLDIAFKPYRYIPRIFEGKEAKLFHSFRKQTGNSVVSEVAFTLWSSLPKEDKSAVTKRLCSKIALFIVERKMTMSNQEMKKYPYIAGELLSKISL